MRRSSPWLQAFARNHPWIGPDFLALNALVWVFVALPAATLCLTASSVWRAGLLLCLAAIVVILPINVETVRDACEINYNGVYNCYGTALFLLTFGAVSDRSRRG